MLHVRRAGFMNAMKLGHWLLARARASGVELVRDEVTGLVVDNQRFVAIRLASGARIDARAFVLAAGPLLPEWTDRLELRVPIVNELHGKISFEDDAGVIPRDAPLMIWNDAVDLGALGTFPAGVHLRPRGVAIDARNLDLRHASRGSDVSSGVRSRLSRHRDPWPGRDDSRPPRVHRARP